MFPKKEGGQFFCQSQYGAVKTFAKQEMILEYGRNYHILETLIQLIDIFFWNYGKMIKRQVRQEREH